MSTLSFSMRHRTTALVLIYLLLLSVVYVPYVMCGGFGVGDDLAIVGSTTHVSDLVPFLKGILVSEGSASRPMSSLFRVAELYLYRNVPAYYIITQLLIWLLAMCSLFKLIKIVIDEKTAWFFILLGSFPLFSSADVFAFFNSIDNNLAIAFWALSLVFLYKHAITGKMHNYISAYILLACGLLTLEVILPLLLISAVFPILCRYRLSDKARDFLKTIAMYAAPVVALSFAFYIFKVYITKLYIADTSYTYGLAPINMKSLLQACYFVFTIFIEVPMLLIEAVPMLFRWQIIAASLLIVLFLIHLRGPMARAGEAKAFIERQFIALVFFTLLACSSIFFLSSYPAVTFGYYNKMMHPAFLLSSILLAWALGKALDSWKIVLAAVVAVLWISSFIIQANNFSRAWDIKKHVLTDIAKKLDSTELGKKPFVIANVPFFTLNNYNNEGVFFTTWDFSFGMKMFGLEKEVRSFPFCWRTVTDGSYYPAQNIKNIASSIENENLWYYEYREGSGKSRIEKIRDKADFYRTLKYSEDNKINYHPLILRERIRNALRDYINSWRMPKRV